MVGGGAPVPGTPAGAAGSKVPGRAGEVGAGAAGPPVRRIDSDCATRPDIMEIAKDSVRKMPPVHHVAFVRSVAAWRLPKRVSEPAPAAPIAARPPPLPACRSTITIRMTESISRRAIKK